MVSTPQRPYPAGVTVTLGGNGYNYIYQNAGNLTLTNVDNTIAGYGWIGSGGLPPLNNQLQGTINANVSARLCT